MALYLEIMLLNSLIDDNDFFIINFLHKNYLCRGTVFTSAFSVLTSLTFPYLTALAKTVRKMSRNCDSGTFAFFSVLNGKCSMAYHLFLKFVNLFNFFFFCPLSTACRILVPWPGISRQRKCHVLTTGFLRNFQELNHFEWC